MGDMALGRAVEEVAGEFESTIGLQEISRLARQSIGKRIILGGGATGVESNICPLAERHRDKAARTAMVGMDFSGDVAEFSGEVLSYLRDVRCISCRSKSQTEKLNDVLGRQDVGFGFDNAFALEAGVVPAPNSGKKVLGYNALNLFMTWKNGGFEPGTPLEDWYQKVDSPIVPYIKKIGPAYIRVFGEALSRYQDQGYRVIHIPFAPEDALFAKTFLKPQTDSFLPYTSDVQEVIRSVGACDRLLSTRYHSLVFGLMGQVPTIPILYAVKCGDLLDDLGIGKERGVARLELVDDPDSCVSKLVNGSPVTLQSGRLDQIKEDVRSTIESAVASVV